MPRPIINSVFVAGLFATTGCYQGVPDQNGEATGGLGSLGGGESGGGEATGGSGGGGDSDSEEEPLEVTPEPVHRLNRLEYNNTVRDLLGVGIRPADNFPPDTATEGFDNLANALTLTPSQVDLYASAARELSEDALTIRPRFSHQVEGRTLAEATGQPGVAFDWGWSLPRGNGALHFSLEVPSEESVTISILAGGDNLAVATPEMGLVVDGVAVGAWAVTATPVDPAVYSVDIPLSAGAHNVAVTFPNGYEQPAKNVYNTLIVGTIDFKSQATVTPPGHDLIYVCDPSAVAEPEVCYRTIVTRLAERAWRHPLSDAEAERVFELWSELAAKEGPDQGVKLTLRALLLSPHFLFRPSLPGLADGDTPPGVVPLNDFSLASRLSYFLWSSMPDDELFELAAAGELRSDEVLQEQVQRMLADPKANGLQEGFAAQWLSTRKIGLHSPDPTVFPTYNNLVEEAMVAESKRFFADFLSNGRPIGEMMAPDFGYLNDPLAGHYGVSPPGSAELVRVDLGEGDRGGLITLGAWLTATSESTRTSPVLRGRWILEQLLCLKMPAPPPDVPPLEPPPEGSTIRETLEQHRENPVCAGCHDLIDPPGLGMEGYDGAGVRRELEGGLPVDESGSLPLEQGFVPFNGGRELAEILAEDPRFVQCLADKLYTYALGRSFDLADRPHLDMIHEEVTASPISLDQLIETIVLSPAFRMRNAGEE